MTAKITNAKQVQSKSRSHEVKQVAGNTYQVTSGHSGDTYKVQIFGDMSGTCTCKWGQYRSHQNCYRSGCSHVVAVFDWIEQGQGRTVSAWTSEDQAKRQHRPMVGIGDGVILTSRKAS